MTLLSTRILAIFAIPAALTIVFVAPVVGQEPEDTRLLVNAAEIALNGRVQTQFNTSSLDGVPTSEVILRRVRLGATLRVNDFIGGRVHVDFAGNAVAIADAYAQLNFSPAAVLMAGRAQRPFGIMEQTTSLQIIPIERGLVIRGVQDYDLSAVLSGLGYGDRDIGLQLRGAPEGAPLGFSYALGYFAGPVQNAAGDHQTEQVVGRLMVAPLPRTRAGVAWSRRDFAHQPVAGTFEVESGDAFLIDLEYGGPTPAPGPHLVAEAALGDFDPFRGEDFAGAQLWAGYRIPFGGRVTVVEPLLRVSHASIDREVPTDSDGGTLVTPGINLFFGGLNRLMLNYDVWRANAGRDASGFKAQLQFTF